MKTFVWADVLRWLFFVNSSDQCVISHWLQYAFHYSIKVVLSILLLLLLSKIWFLKWTHTYLNDFNAPFHLSEITMYAWSHSSEHFCVDPTFYLQVELCLKHFFFFCELSCVDMRGKATNCSLGSSSQPLSKKRFLITLDKVVVLASLLWLFKSMSWRFECKKVVNPVFWNICFVALLIKSICWL